MRRFFISKAIGSLIIIVFVIVVIGVISFNKNNESKVEKESNNLTSSNFYDDNSYEPESDNNMTAEYDYQALPNIQYANFDGFDSNLTSLDLFVPQGGKDYPVVVFIHGGAWATGDKGNHEIKGKYFAERGFIFASINYRLYPEVDYSAQAQDVAKALTWLYQNASQYGGDKTKLFLIGHSAGAHLAALVSADERYLTNEGLNLSVLSGVITLDGAGFDLNQVRDLNPRLFERNYQPVFGNSENVLQNASPTNYIAPGKNIPPYIMFYVEGRELSNQEAIALADKLTAINVSADIAEAISKTHETINQDFGLAGDQVTEQTFVFIKNLL